MKQLSIRIVLAVALIAGVTVLVAPSAESVSEPMFFWVYTPQAEIRTLRGDCPENQLCKELCERVNGDTHLTGQFQCFPDI